MRSDPEGAHHEMPRSGEHVRARGRVDPEAGEGSLLFETDHRPARRESVEALVAEFPGVRFTVFGEPDRDAWPLQEYWEARLAARAWWRLRAAIPD